MKKLEINFNISEFNISGRPLPEKIADKILHYHIKPMQPVRDKLKIKMWPSLKSGYRSVAWEETHGRSGNSQHTFKEKGATDWTCEDFIQNKKEFLKEIIELTDYTRMAVYDSFIHCDYKDTPTGKRQIFKSDSASNWVFICHAEDYKDETL